MRPCQKLFHISTLYLICLKMFVPLFKPNHYRLANLNQLMFWQVVSIYLCVCVCVSVCVFVSLDKTHHYALDTLRELMCSRVVSIYLCVCVCVSVCVFVCLCMSVVLY